MSVNVDVQVEEKMTQCDQNLALEILRHASVEPDSPALMSAEKTITYAELKDKAERAASLLAERGVKAGDIVGIALREGPPTMIAMLGTWLLGATCNLIEFRSAAKEKQELYDRYGHAVILEDINTEAGGYPSLSSNEWKTEMEAANPVARQNVLNAEPAYISFSSGTTGIPTSFKVSHSAMLARAASWRGSDIWHVYKRYLSTAPLSFSGTQGWVINTLLYGGCVVFFPIFFRPQDLLDAFQRYQITGCALVPTVLRDLLAHVQASGQTSLAIEEPPWIVTHGAAILTNELKSIQSLLSPKVIQIYGSWGAGPMAYLDLSKEGQKIDTVGRPQPGVDLEIVDDADVSQPKNTVGKIRVRTPGLASLTDGSTRNAGSDSFKSEWYYPGDLGLIDDDGYLQLLGRSGDMIIRGGVNLYPHEIEAVAAELPGIKQVAALGYPDDRLGEEIALFVVAETFINEVAVHRHCNRNLSPDKRPKRIYFVDDMPVNSNGKILKRKLLEMMEIFPKG